MGQLKFHHFQVVKGVIHDLYTHENVGVVYRSYIHRDSRFPWQGLVEGRWGTGNTAENAARRALQAAHPGVIWVYKGV